MSDQSNKQTNIFGNDTNINKDSANKNDSVNVGNGKVNKVDGETQSSTLSNDKEIKNDDTQPNNEESLVKRKAEEHGQENDNGNDSKNKKPKLIYTDNVDKPKLPKKKKHMNPDVLELRRRIQIACSSNDLRMAMIAYQEFAIAKNVRMEAQSFYNLLNLCDGLDRTNIVHIGTPKTSSTNGKTQTMTANNNPVQSTNEHNDNIDNNNTESTKGDKNDLVSLSDRLQFAHELIKHMEELSFPLNETACTAMVKLLSKSREFQQAKEMIAKAEKIPQCKPKLRLYSALLVAYCQEEEGEEEYKMLMEALQVWKQLCKQQLTISEKELSALLSCATKSGNAIVVEHVLSQLAEDVLIPSKDTTTAIRTWFESEFAKKVKSTPTTADNIIMNQEQQQQQNKVIVELLKECHIHPTNSIMSQLPLPNMGPVVHDNGWDVSTSCTIDTKTGTITSGCIQNWKLKPVFISSQSWQDMIQMNQSIVTQGEVNGHTSQFQGGKKGKKRKDFSPQQRQNNWNSFCKYLQDNFTSLNVVIDGANVGYYEQNFAGAPKHVDYNQIDWIVQHLVVTKQQKVLLVLHQRHFQQHVLNMANANHIVQKWQQQGILYKSPPGMNDDWFWLHAALKYKSLVLTNDEMRDHHFQMLAPRMFIRWKDRHQVHFSFGSWQKQQQSRQVLLTYPEVYSRRIQRIIIITTNETKSNDNGEDSDADMTTTSVTADSALVVPLPKRGDEHRFLDGLHVASDDEPVEETYLCIRPKGVI